MSNKKLLPGEIFLYHYSNEDNLKTIDPKFFGSNLHTPFEASSTLRSYFYCDKITREKFFRGARFRYAVKVNRLLLYDGIRDPEGYFEDCVRLESILNELKTTGYIGVIFSQWEYQVVALFYQSEVLAKVKL